MVNSRRANGCTVVVDYERIDTSPNAFLSNNTQLSHDKSVYITVLKTIHNVIRLLPETRVEFEVSWCKTTIILHQCLECDASPTISSSQEPFVGTSISFQTIYTTSFFLVSRENAASFSPTLYSNQKLSLNVNPMNLLRICEVEFFLCACK